MERPLTDLDRKLQEIAIKNWWQFVDIIGNDAVTTAKVCLLRRDGKTYGQIMNKLELTKNQVEYGCGKCDVKQE